MSFVEPLTTPDHYTKCSYGRNAILDNPSVNVTFADVRKMNGQQWTQWLERVRLAILEQWDVHGIPPRVGLDDHEIGQAFDRLTASSSDDVWVRCDDGVLGLQAPSAASSFISQFFPTMMKTRIVTGSIDKALSIYDMLAKEEVWDRYTNSFAARHYLRDSFYAYSRAIHTHEEIPTLPGVVATSAKDYLLKLRDNPTLTTDSLFGESYTPTWEVWLAPATPDDTYNGYSSGMQNRSIWTVTQEEALELRKELPVHWTRDVTDQLKAKKTHYMLRLYSSDTTIFPDGFRSLRISMCQYAVNFPAPAARALYEKYTAGIDRPLIYDPCLGWGGRLVGALTTANRARFVGTDVNVDHYWTDDNGERHSKYTELAALAATRRPLEEPPDVTIFQCGSELIEDHPDFQKFIGQVDLAGTSPGYFAKEVYKDDPAQGAIKFNTFETWCEGYLKPTIEAAVRSLKSGGVLWWNVADVKIGGKFLPIEAKSREYALAVGMTEEPSIRLILAAMPGGNRKNEDGSGTARNTCMLNGRLTKFEPILIFRRPT